MTGRALSYDERPRQVVHALREHGEPVSCLVQHQSELKRLAFSGMDLFRADRRTAVQ